MACAPSSSTVLLSASRSCSSRWRRSARRSPSTTRSSASLVRRGAHRARAPGRPQLRRRHRRPGGPRARRQGRVRAVAGRLRLRLRGRRARRGRGTSRAVVNDAPRGAPGNPMTHDDIVAKFTANATLSLPARRPRASPPRSTASTTPPTSPPSPLACAAPRQRERPSTTNGSGRASARSARRSPTRTGATSTRAASTPRRPSRP